MKFEKEFRKQRDMVLISRQDTHEITNGLS